MNYGLYLSSSGALAASYRQDVAANNLANVNTVGFKPDLTLAMARQPERQEGHMGRALANELLERLGGGVINGPQHLNVRGGSPTPTGNPLDAALLQDDTFFHVRVPDPDTGGFEDRLTRDGRMLVGPDGTLQHIDGHQVLSDAGTPIRLEPGVPAQIEADGRVTQDGQTTARLGIAQVSAPHVLNKAGHNLLFPPAGDAPLTYSDAPRLAMGSTESSGADPIRSLMHVISATKSATGNLRMVSYHDQTMDKAINQLSRVA